MLQYINDDFNFYKNQKILSIEHNREIFKFFVLRYGADCKPYYHCMPLYNTITNSTKFRYCTIPINGDNIFVMYKVVQISGIYQIRIIDTPISQNLNRDNEQFILTEFLKLPFVKVAYKENFNDWGLNGSPLILYNDYYYDFSTHKFNGAYRSKHGINKMIANKDFKIDVVHGSDDKKILELRESWIRTMQDNGSLVNTASTRDFKRFVQAKNENIIDIIIYYKGQPISIQVLLLCKVLNFADCLYIVHNGRIHSDDLELNRVLKNMCDIQNYLAYIELEKFNIHFMYIAGCRPEERRLLKHKERVSDGCLRYLLDDNKLHYHNITLSKKSSRKLF